MAFRNPCSGLKIPCGIKNVVGIHVHKVQYMSMHMQKYVCNNSKSQTYVEIENKSVTGFIQVKSVSLMPHKYTGNEG